MILKRVVSILLILALFFNVFAYFLAYRIEIKGLNRHYQEHIYYSSFGTTEDFIILNGEIQSNKVQNDLFENDDLLYYGKKFELITAEKHGGNNILISIKDNELEKRQVSFNNNLIHLNKSKTPLPQKNHRLIIPVFKVPVAEKNTIPLFSKDVKSGAFYFYSVQTAVLNDIFVPPRFSLSIIQDTDLMA